MKLESGSELETAKGPVISSEHHEYYEQSQPIQHPVFEKFESKHVTQFLENSHAVDVEVQRQRSTDRNYAFAYFLTGVLVFLIVFFGLAYYLLPENLGAFIDFVVPTVTFVVGGFGGYGWAHRRSSTNTYL